RYVVEGVSVSGNTAVTSTDVLGALRLKKGDPYVQSTVDAGTTVVRNLYRNIGYNAAEARATANELPKRESKDVERPVDVAGAVTQGVRTLIRSVTIRGNVAVAEEDLRKALMSVAGRPYAEVDLVADR